MSHEHLESIDYDSPWTQEEFLAYDNRLLEDAKNAPQADKYEELFELCSSYMNDEQLRVINRAYNFARLKHAKQRRRSGEPYINHPVEVGIILAHISMDQDTVASAVLHDTVEDTDTSLKVVEHLFGAEVAGLVDGVTKLTNIEVDSLSAQQAQNLRKMFLAMSKDIRVIIIKLADRLHNMRTLMALPEDRRIFKAKETLEIYTPLANRLGISSMKWELEDLAFFYLEPAKYQQIQRMVSESRSKREAYLAQVITILESEIDNLDGSFQINGRPKHLYSIYQKMKSKDKDFSEIYDLIALRVITKTIKDCYSVLGTVHSLWKPMPGRFKDYIAMPKFNMYQSLHTTVIGPAGRPLEIQIRTEEMHKQDEYGIAAHWLYKESGNSLGDKDEQSKSLDEKLGWLKRTLDWQSLDDMSDPQEYLDSLKIDLFDSEVFVFTPKGDVMSLRMGSTPIDFAYAIHTEVGHHCVGAKVNGSVVPLSYELQLGDRVEIITQKNSAPSRDWLNIVKTSSARAKIKSYFSKISKDDDTLNGKEMLARELRKSGLGISNSRSTRVLNEVASNLGLGSIDDLFASIGAGKTTVRLVANKVLNLLDKENDPALEAEKRALLSFEVPMKAPRANRPKKKRSQNQGVIVGGDAGDGMLVRLAHCCNPVVGDDIIGFITRGRGISVHRANCPNAQDLLKNPERMIDVSWDHDQNLDSQVEIVITAQDRLRLLQDITVTIADYGVNILSAATHTDKSGMVEMRLLLELSSIAQLDALLRKVKQVEGVRNARRLNPGEGATTKKKH
ncbi:MAG: bifunctional (p)ppGpp synthetase/guanosine-3',5'-bis(diphosphate) 3'-pyrophosphohydrolase [Coriobacteriia bacterium]|nr:bifunctional (p)ppGpp synthetase/guanosine-3',5'-bis(diphosphate) 3'-pyrophosphohydrolase [Coriobacteriia bacterium]